MKKILLLSALLLLAMISFTLPVSAETSLQSDAQLDNIRSNCTTIKNSLNQLHASDALMRVNRGQLYESISSKLMQRFATRVANNQISNSNLTAIDSNYQTYLTNFREDYISYDKALSLAINTDCQNQTADFINNIEKARQRRAILHEDTMKLNSLIEEYAVKFNMIKESVLGINNGLKQ